MPNDEPFPAKKNPNERRSLGIDWTEKLSRVGIDDLIITESDWEVLSGDVTINDETAENEYGLYGKTHNGYITAVWCEGGTEGSTSLVRNTVLTSSSHRWSQSIELTVGDYIDNETTGRYTTLADIEDIFGRNNVRKWANIDEFDNAAVDARIVNHIADAEDEIDGLLSGTLYAIPFVEPIPRIIRRTAARLAGCNLYDARGVVDADDPSKDRLQIHRNKVLLTIARIKRGEIKITVDDDEPPIGYPRVLCDDDDETEPGLALYDELFNAG